MRRRANRIILVLVVIVLLALLLPPFINVNRYKLRIAEAISNGMGRQVTIGHITLRLIPQPGFDMENLVVADDPAFSAEPLLRADEVTANLRLSSLWRGRLEIARLSLSYPSLNLVVTPDNKLNLEALLSRATHTSTAPTTAKRPESRPRFPYIEAENGRINLKFGLEKQVFALTETEFALWSPWEDEWRMRLESRPVRTDVAISDTGTLKIEGSFHRADNLLHTPVKLNYSIERIQLGQLTKLVSGRDRGWRGGMNLEGTVDGQVGLPHFTLHATVDDFRRYDIVRGEPLRLEAQCEGEYASRLLSASQRDSANWRCTLPIGSGNLQVSTALSSTPPATYSVRVLAHDLPMSSVVAFARHGKRDLPDDLSATGTLTGTLEIAHDMRDAAAQIVGDGTATNVVLRSSVLEKELALGNITLSAARTPALPANNRRNAPVTTPQLARLNIQPFTIAAGGVTPASVNGWLSRSGYGFTLNGDAEMSRLLEIARSLGIGVPKIGIFGPARVQVELAGEWKGFTQPTATGTALLKNVRAEVPGIASPVQIASASVSLAANDIRMQNVAAAVDKIALTGSAAFPRHCEAEMPCVSRYDILADELNADMVNRLVNPRLKNRPWYKMFGGDSEQSLLAIAQAEGRVGAKRFIAGSLVANRLNADFRMNKGVLELSNVRADVFGGTHSGKWTADFTGKQPVYTGSGTLQRAALAQIAALARDAWGTGTVSGSYELNLKGWTGAELAALAEGTSQVQLTDTTFRHIVLESRGTPLRATTFAGRISLAKGVLRIEPSKMQTPNGIYEVSGTATFNRNLELTLQKGGVPAYSVTGTLEKPQLVAAPTRQAEATAKP